MRKCNLCSRKLRDKWNYCPRCGAEVNKKINMFNLLRRQMDILRNLMVDSNMEQNVQSPRNAITIRIDSNGFRNPRVNLYPQPKQKKDINDAKRTEPKKLTGKVIEPDVKVKRLSNEIMFKIPLPDVKSEKNVELNRLTDSLEVRAFARDKGYFKILNVPRNHKLIDKSLDNGTLNLKFAA